MARGRAPVSYRGLQAWGRIAVHALFRRVEVTGTSNIPANRPAILAANHSNALVDIALIVAKLRQFPRFLAAASWWKSAPARVLFRLGGVVPIYRSRDGNGTEQNVSTFAACHTELAQRAHIAIFPEGEMHTGPALMPLKTGAARIALGAATEAGVPGVVLVPVGIVYEDRGRFRSDAEIRFGDPIEIDEWVELARADSDKAARDVTDLLADRLAEVTVNHGSREEAELADRAAELALADASDTERSFAHRNRLRRDLASALSDAAGGIESDELAAAVAAHDDDLAALDISASQPAPSLAEPSDVDRSRLEGELKWLAPPALLGLVANAPVVAAATVAASRATREWRLTAIGLTGTFLCPVVWTAEYVYLARHMGRGRAFVLTVGGATGGLAALAWRGRYDRFREMNWLDRVGREKPAALDSARASRAVVCKRVDALTRTS